MIYALAVILLSTFSRICQPLATCQAIDTPKTYHDIQITCHITDTDNTLTGENKSAVSERKPLTSARGYEIISYSQLRKPLRERENK
jgi:hypothetical protein